MIRANNDKTKGCNRCIKKLCVGNVRYNTGTAMIVFGIPLLIPGITLTTVAFHDETGFARYSALHVLGMILLALAILFILAGVLLRVRSTYKIDLDDRVHMVSTHDKIQERVVMDTGVASSTREYRYPDINRSTNFSPDTAHVNYMTVEESSTTTCDLFVSYPAESASTSYTSKRKFQIPPHPSRGRASSSSSDDTSDSDECSSRYDAMMATDVADGRQNLRPRPELPDIHKDSASTRSRPVFSFRDFMMSRSQSEEVNLNNFFYHPAKITEVVEVPDHTGKCSPHNTPPLQHRFESEKSEGSSFSKDTGVFLVQTSHLQETYPSQAPTDSVAEVRHNQNESYTDASHVHSETNLVHTDTNHVHSDINHVHVGTNHIHLDTNHVHSGTSRAHVDTNLVHSDTTLVHSNTNLVHSDTTLVYSNTIHEQSETTVSSTRKLADMYVHKEDKTRKDLRQNNISKRNINITHNNNNTDKNWSSSPYASPSPRPKMSRSPARIFKKQASGRKQPTRVPETAFPRKDDSRIKVAIVRPQHRTT